MERNIVLIENLARIEEQLRTNDNPRLGAPLREGGRGGRDDVEKWTPPPGGGDLQTNIVTDLQHSHRRTGKNRATLKQVGESKKPRDSIGLVRATSTSLRRRPQNHRIGSLHEKGRKR